MIISYRLWQRRFGGDPNIINQSITLDDRNCPVVAVMPPQFYFPDRENDIWVPMAFTSDQLAARGAHYLMVVGRIKQGITPEQAQSDMNTVAAKLSEQYPQTNTSVGATVSTFRTIIACLTVPGGRVAPSARNCSWS